MKEYQIENSKNNIVKDCKSCKIKTRNNGYIINEFLIAISLMIISLSGFSQTKPPINSSSTQQTLYSLIQNCQEIVDVKEHYTTNQMWKAKMEDESYKNQSISFIGEILSLNVIRYYGIRGYDTDLKQHLYKETEEYKKLESELKTIKQKLLNQTFYYLVPIEKNYNVEKKAFSLSSSLIESKYPDVPGYLAFEDLCIEYATKRFPKN